MHLKRLSYFLRNAATGEVGDLGGGASAVAETAAPTGPVSADNPFAGDIPENLPTDFGKPETATLPKSETVPAAPVTPVTPAQLSPERIATIAAEAAARVGQQAAQGQTPSEQPAMTQEQFDKTFNVVKLDSAGFTSIMGYAPDSPAQVSALNNVLQGVVRQALTMTQVHVENVTKALEAKFSQQVSPIVAEREANVGKQLENEFFQKNPDLVPFKALALATAENLKRENLRFTSKEEAFATVVARTRALIPQGVTFQTPGAAPAAPVRPPTTRTMASTSVGGQVSAPTGGHLQTSDAKSIFG